MVSGKQGRQQQLIPKGVQSSPRITDVALHYRAALTLNSVWDEIDADFCGLGALPRYLDYKYVVFRVRISIGD